MTSQPPSSSHRKHRRSRHRSPASRALRFLGLGQSRGRVLLLLLAVAVVAIASAVAITTPPEVAPGSSASPNASPSATTVANASPTARPTASSTLPSVATPTPAVTPTPAPVGIVAKRIRIERLSIDLPIVEGDGIDAPMNKAAHYPDTGWPGGGINIYLYGHAQTNMFLTLWDAKVGDQVLLDLANGTTRTYVVTTVLPRVPWDAMQYVEATAPERLTLQTSTSYGPTQPRFIVIADPVPAS